MTIYRNSKADPVFRKVEKKGKKRIKVVALAEAQEQALCQRMP